MYDLSKLHPIHQKNFSSFVNSEFRDTLTPDGRLARDVLYKKYVDMKKTIPDIIGKQTEDLTQDQKDRMEEKIHEA